MNAPLQMKKILVCIWCIVICCSSGGASAAWFSESTKDVFRQLRQKWIKVFTNDALDIQQPTWIIPTTGSIDKLNTWLQYRLDRLPYASDKSGDRYVVIPRLWVVVPIIDIPPSSPQYWLVFKWLSIDFNEYLQLWVVHYPSVYWWQRWNMIIAGHSSYWKKDPWRYKNIFLTLPLLSIHDQIWVYEKSASWIFNRYVYYVDRSFQTLPYDVAILKQTRTKRLTLFTCVPIGTVQSRRVTQAKMPVVTSQLIHKR